MRNKILIITSSYDKTCDYIIKKYSELDFFRFDIDQFSEYRVTFTSKGFQINSTNCYIDSLTCLSIYFRKPIMENLDGIFEDDYHSYIHKETYSMIEGIVESFRGVVLTKPSIMRRANNKIYQASIATDAGFISPEFSITNNITELNYFTNIKGIIKPLAIGEITKNSKKEFVQTNLIDSSYKTDKFQYSPVYLQDYIDKEYEVRVTIVDKHIYPVKICSDNNVDWRKPNNKVIYEICLIPEEIKNSCFKFMKSCSMNFGCFDFIVKNNIWYFLEMNANGQWAWLEIEMGLDISKSIIDFLTNDII